MARILIVDDSNVTRSLVKLTLETLDNIIVDASDNVQGGLTLCQKHHYDILILDYMMPVHTGLEMIALLNEKHLQENTPIFILSAESDTHLKERAKNHRVKAWLKKPFRPEKLLNLVTTTLCKAR